MEDKKHSYRHCASFGKRMEHYLIAKMLKEGMDVYLPMIDDDAIDAVVKRKPLLAIYSVQPKEANNDLSKYLIPLISLGIPELGPKESKYVNYTINKVYQMQMIEEEEMTEE